MSAHNGYFLRNIHLICKWFTWVCFAQKRNKQKFVQSKLLSEIGCTSWAREGFSDSDSKSDADFEKKNEYSISNFRSNRIIRKLNIRNLRKIFEVNRIFDSIFFY
jgi:hypothetical protein